MLLDHVTDINKVMVGFLRRLRGGIVGVLMVVDVDVERERQRMRDWRSVGLYLRMPVTSSVHLQKLFRSSFDRRTCQRVDRDDERRIIRAARGRPGWAIRCAQLASQARYWRNGTLLMSILCSDTEILLRYGDLRLVQPPGELIGLPVSGISNP